jgi:ABC-type multidrug transport system fused ATPase/permease subunit
LSLKENIIISDVGEKKENLYDMVCNSTGIKKIQEYYGNDEVLLRKEIFEDAVDFSGGEKQKIKLARALYADRDIIVFDEPLSSLDTTSERKFIDLIFNGYKDRTVIVITHNLSCTKLCDKIISMENGLIQEIGSHKQLIKNKGLYYTFYIAQAKRYKEIENEKT